MKSCIRCKESKSKEAYPLPKSKICKKCQSRRARIAERYSLSWQDYEHMKHMQAGGCAICKCDIPEGGKINVDHDHKTGKVRGLLCRDCNLALGFFKDSLDNIRNALRYLSKDE
jgi:hypothetical protein